MKLRTRIKNNGDLLIEQTTDEHSGEFRVETVRDKTFIPLKVKGDEFGETTVDELYFVSNLATLSGSTLVIKVSGTTESNLYAVSSSFAETIDVLSGNITSSFDVTNQSILDLSATFVTHSLQTINDVQNGFPSASYHLMGNGTHWNSQDFATDVFQSFGNLMQDPTGFPMPGGGSLTTLLAENNIRRLTISPVSASFDVYVLGEKFNYATPQSTVWDDVEGIHVFYFNSVGTLTSSLLTNVSLKDIIINNAMLAATYWNSAQ